MNRKINIDQPQPGSDDIRRKMDLQGVLNSHPPAPSISPMKMGAAIAALIVLSATVWWFWPGENLTPTIADSTTTVGKTALRDRYPLPSETFTIDPDTATIIATDNGTIISIPAHAFNLNDLAGEITLSFTDISKPLAVFVSEIPMHYDSAGTRYHFQSAGMFEVTARLGEKDIDLADGKNIQISYPTINEDPGFRNYTYNEQHNAWQFESPSFLETAEDICNRHGITYTAPETTDGIITQTSGTKADIQVPEKPVLANKDNYRFHLDIDPQEFPELANMIDVMFEATDPRFEYHFFNTTWEDVELNKRGAKYTLVLKEGKTEKRFQVYPVLEQKEFDLAMDKYNSLKLENEKAVTSDNRQHWEEEMAALPVVTAGNMSVSKATRVLGEIFVDFNEGKNYRSINLPSLGVVNFDTPITFPKGCELPADFIIVNHEEKRNRLPRVMLVEPENKVYVSYFSGDYDEFRYRKRNANWLLSANDAGDVAFVSDAAFAPINKDATFHLFELNWAPSDVSSFEDLEAFIESQEAL